VVAVSVASRVAKLVSVECDAEARSGRSVVSGTAGCQKHGSQLTGGGRRLQGAEWATYSHVTHVARVSTARCRAEAQNYFSVESNQNVESKKNIF